MKPAEGLLQCTRRRGVSVWAENVEPDVHESKEKRGLDEEASEDDSQSLETSWIWTWRGAGRQSAFSSPKSFLKYLLIYLAVLGLSCSTQGLQLQYVGLNSLASDRTWASALGAKSLSHWTTREVPKIFLSKQELCISWQLWPCNWGLIKVFFIFVLNLFQFFSIKIFEEILHF